MSSYSSTYPAIRPTYQIDFSNGGRIPPNATFSRSDSPIDATKAAASAVHFWSNEKHLSSDNLLLQSSDFDTTWSANGLNGTPTSGQADPAGGTDGFTLVEDSSTGIHRVSQNVTASGDLALTVYAKQNSGTRYLTLALYYATGNTAMAVYDLAGGSPVTATGASSTYTSVSASQTASGNGYYKCVLKATGSATVAIVNLNDVATTVGLDTNWGTKSYTGDNSSSLDIAFASLSTTGTGYNATTTQIHREYAPTLKSVATAGAARFEYDPTDGQSAGTSLGILVESQSTNAVGYSDSLASWNQSRLTATNASAVGPTGSLNAALLTPSTDAGFEHIIYATSVTTSVTGTVTLSGYFKAAGYDYVTLGIGNTATGNFSHALFNLSTGAYVTNNSGGSNSYVSSSTESVGNGWWRLVATFSTSRSNEQFVIGPASTSSPTYDSNWGTPTYTGDGYSSVLATGIQAEVGKSFASSLITSNSGSETTRASDSLSVATADIGYTGGPVTLTADYDMVDPTANVAAQNILLLSDGSSSNRVLLYNRSGKSGGYVASADGSTTASGNPSSTAAGAHKLCVVADTNNYIMSFDGTSSTDTAAVLPSGLNQIDIGSGSFSGHVSRVSLFGTAISETAANALTS